MEVAHPEAAVQRSASGDAELAREIQALEEEERTLREMVDAAVIEQRKEDALLLISRFAQQYGAIVDLEDNNAVIKLDTRALTIRILNERGESAWLRQVGSGANHLGYHVATMLALHEFFLQRGIPYVPSLLVLDQPSQTQFPDDMDEEAEQQELIAVHKAFEAFDSAIDRTAGRLQIIVSEHASKTVSAGIRHLTVVERWRWGRKLIPWNWDTEALEALNGTRADFALEDLTPVLVPAIVATMKLPGASHVKDVTIRRAVFEKLQIAFEVDATIDPAPGDGSIADERSRMISIRGFVAQDLTVSIQVPPPAKT